MSGQLQLYHNLYRACLAGAGICLLLTTVLFWRLRIDRVIGYFTGGRARREIRRLEISGTEVQKDAMAEFGGRERKTIWIGRTEVLGSEYVKKYSRKGEV